MLHSYLITDPFYYYDFENTLTSVIENHNPDYICFRDKSSIKNAKKAIEIAKFYNIPILINQYVELINLGFDGIHFTSTQLDIIKDYSQCLRFASTHNTKEVQKAKYVDFITFSPIFSSKGRKGLGVDKLKEISEISKPKVFALGGIVGDEEVKEISKVNVYGFACIRYFLEKR